MLREQLVRQPNGKGLSNWKINGKHRVAQISAALSVGLTRRVYRISSVSLKQTEAGWTQRLDANKTAQDTTMEWTQINLPSPTVCSLESHICGTRLPHICDILHWRTSHG